MPVVKRTGPLPPNHPFAGQRVHFGARRPGSSKENSVGSEPPFQVQGLLLPPTRSHCFAERSYRRSIHEQEE
jgi:hypothetical protein